MACGYDGVVPVVVCGGVDHLTAESDLGRQDPCLRVPAARVSKEGPCKLVHVHAPTSSVLTDSRSTLAGSNYARPSSLDTTPKVDKRPSWRPSP